MARHWTADTGHRTPEIPNPRFSVVFGCFNLFSRPRIVPVPAIVFSAMDFTHSAQRASLPFSARNSQFICQSRSRLIQSLSLLPQTSFPCMLVSYLMNYKWRNRKHFCRSGHPTTPRSTIRDRARSSASPIHRVFCQFQSKEFPRLDRRKARKPPLCTFQVFRALWGEFLLSQTTSH